MYIIMLSSFGAFTHGGLMLESGQLNALPQQFSTIYFWGPY